MKQKCTEGKDMAAETLALKQKPRVLWVDFAKVFGIWLMVLVHMKDMPNYILVFMGSFIMQLFFFISGFLENNKRNLKDTIVGGLKSLVIPYYILYFLLYIFFILTSFLPDYLKAAEFGIQSTINIPKEMVLKPILGILLCIPVNTSFSTMLLIPMWFLMGLFFVRIFHKIIAMTAKSNIMLHALLSIPLFIALTYGIRYAEYKFNFRIPFSIDCAIMSVPFFSIGNIARKLNWFQQPAEINIVSTGVKILISIVLFSVYGVLARINGFSSIADMDFGRNIVLYYFLASLGAIAGVFFSYIYVKPLLYIAIIADGTMLIMAYHNSVFLFVYEILAVFDVEITVLVNVFISVLIVVFSVIPTLIVQRYFTILIGGKKLPPDF
jgi:fucose 4-O-acetylase-like acetyltransferase